MTKNGFHLTILMVPFEMEKRDREKFHADEFYS